MLTVRQTHCLMAKLIARMADESTIGSYSTSPTDCSRQWELTDIYIRNCSRQWELTGKYSRNCSHQCFSIEFIFRMS